MKKTAIALSALLLLGTTGFSQRNGNQKQFKRMSSLNYINQEAEMSFGDESGLFETNAYQQNSFGGINQYVKDNEIIFEVKSLMNVKADGFLAVFNLTQIGETATVTNDLLNERLKNFTEAIKKLEIKDDNIYVDMIYLIPTFEFEVEKKLFSKSYNEVPTGFEMQKNIHISFTDINLVDELVTLAAQNEIYDMVKLDFFVNDTEGVYDTLRDKSVDYLNKKLTSYKKLNTNLDEVFHTVRESSTAIYPDTQYSDYNAFVSQSIEAVSKNSGISKIRKPETVAYDQIPYNRFQIVLNPNILEPVVQYVYTLQVRYTLEKPEVKKEIKFINRDGVITNLNL